MLNIYYSSIYKSNYIDILYKKFNECFKQKEAKYVTTVNQATEAPCILTASISVYNKDDENEILGLIKRDKFFGSPSHARISSVHYSTYESDKKGTSSYVYTIYIYIYQDFAFVPSDIFLIYICPRRAGVGDGAARDGPHPDPVRRPAPSPGQPAILLPPARKKTNAETRIKLSIKQRKKAWTLGNGRISNFPDTIGASPETGHNAGYPTIKVGY